MQKNTYILLIEILLLCSSNIAIADNTKYNLMTARDIKSHSFSNITIQNKTGSGITVYGLYINQFADNSPVPHNCTSPQILFQPQYPNTYASGAFVTPVSLAKNQKIPIGKNYLYNMIYTAIYYGNQIPSGTPMPCTLPGCSWTTDQSNIGDQWCVYLGILAPANGNSTTANVPPMGNLVSSTGYNYDLVTQYGYIGPISCDDKTLTCEVSIAQNVAFPQ